MQKDQHIHMDKQKTFLTNRLKEVRERHRQEVRVKKIEVSESEKERGQGER